MPLQPKGGRIALSAEIRITYRNSERTVPGPQTVRQLLDLLALNPETVLVSVNGALVTEDTKVEPGSTVRVIDVVSGG
jgi:sulfur carrier protein ThiS